MSAEPILETDADAGVEKGKATRRRQRIEAALALPERPKTARRGEMGGWMAEAVCAGRTDLGLTEVERQADAAEIVATYCDRCPVWEACLTEGRAAHGSGLYGGLVLDDGHLGRDTDRLADAFRDPQVWLAPTPTPTLEAVPDAEDDLEPTSTLEPAKGAQPTEPTKGEQPTEPTKGARAGGGQRWQPRRRSRAQRRRGRR